MARWTLEDYQAVTGKKLPRKKQMERKLVIAGGGYTSNVQGWRQIGDKKIYLRSLWEMNFAHYLQFIYEREKILKWEYEPKLFKFPKEKYAGGPFQYLPDFLVTNNDKSEIWYEVKGYLNPASKKKLKRFYENFPNEELEIISKKWFNNANKHYSSVIPNWETVESAKAKNLEIDEKPPK